MTRIATAVLGVCLVFSAAAAQASEGELSPARVDLITKLDATHRTAQQAKGLEIYKKQFEHDVGWHTLEVRLDMTLIDAAGHESRRKVIKREIEDADVPNKTLGIFLEPTDVRGTVMLTHEQSHGSDEQWLYLPSLKRTKKINAENKSGSFLGTEFSWEDLSTRELTKYSYEYLRDDGDSWVVARVPVYKFSGYSRQVTWVSKSNYQTVKIEYYDKKGDLLKTQVLGKWQQYDGGFWRPLQLEMTNHVNKKKTLMALTPYRMNAGLDKRMFSNLSLDQIQLSELVAFGR